MFRKPFKSPLLRTLSGQSGDRHDSSDQPAKRRRIGEDASRHDWVLDIDADEVVTPELAEEIRGIFAAGPQFQMYEVTLITVPPFGAPWRNFKRAYRVKLYDKRHIRIPDHAAWDQFKVPPGAKLGTIRLRSTPGSPAPPFMP